MKKVLTKLAKARKIISNTPVKKKGRNDYSKYEYFTPDQVHKLVEDACQEVGIISLYSISKKDNGYEGVLEIVDLESGEQYTFNMSTDMPDIKATNSTQKLGGMVTYNERYMKMSAFGIVDNNLDPDSQDNRPKQPKPAPKKEQGHEQAFINRIKKEGGLTTGAAGAIQKARSLWGDAKTMELLSQAGWGDDKVQEAWKS